jgi:hypothetical protein
MLAATGYLTAAFENGAASGNCVAVDRERRLAVTASFVVDRARAIRVAFPAYRGGSS